jgi:glycosyltransferase involved in cell wall biosynthesis
MAYAKELEQKSKDLNSPLDLPRVCLVSFEFPPRGGGEGAYTLNLAIALKKLGCDVTVLTPPTPGHPKIDASILDVKWIDLPGIRMVSFGIMARRKIREICRQMNIDLIHYTSDYTGFGMSRSETSKPIVATIHHVHHAELEAVTRSGVVSGVSNLRYHARMWLLDRLERNTLLKADKIIAVSDFTAKCAVERHGISPDKISVIRNAVNTEVFTAKVDTTILRDNLDIRLKDVPIILYVGRLSLNKGLQFLISAFSSVVKKVPKAVLAIVGDASEEQKAFLNQMAAKQGITDGLVFLGRVSDIDLPGIYSLADVVVLPSLMEGCGISLLEGMAMGKPCIGSRVGGIPEMIQHGHTGLLVPPGDIAELADAICTILSDANLARRIGHAARKEVEQHFSLASMGKKVLDAYRGISLDTAPATV